MSLFTVLIPVNKFPQYDDAFTIQCKKICKFLSKRIELKIFWIMFPSIPPYKKSEITSDHNILFLDEGNSLIQIFDLIKPNMVFVNGSLDFHNVETVLISKSLKIPVFSLFFRNPYVPKSSFSSTLIARLRGLTTKYGDNVENFKPTSSFTIKFYLKQFRRLYSTLKINGFTTIKSVNFILKYIKIVSSDVNPIDKIIAGNLNFCNLDKMKENLLLSNFDNSSIFVVGDPYFDDHKIIKPKYFVEKKSSKSNILFVSAPNHEHGLCSKEKEFNLIIDIINIIQKEGYDISLKIHPSSSILIDYENALKNKTLKQVHIFQSEPLTDLLLDYDLMITYGGTGAIHDAALLGKPILNLDFDKTLTGQSVHYFDQIITHCKNISTLISDISSAEQKMIIQTDIEKFAKKYLGYSIKKPSENIVNIIHSFISKNYSGKK